MLAQVGAQSNRRRRADGLRTRPVTSMRPAARPALGGGSILVYSVDMTRPLPLIAGLLGVVFLAIAAMYWSIPAGGLPSFVPGFEAGGGHIHVKHGIGSLVIALALFAFAWFQSRRERQ